MRPGCPKFLESFAIVLGVRLFGVGAWNALCYPRDSINFLVESHGILQVPAQLIVKNPKKPTTAAPRKGQFGIRLVVVKTVPRVRASAPPRTRPRAHTRVQGRE